MDAERRGEMCVANRANRKGKGMRSRGEVLD